MGEWCSFSLTDVTRVCQAFDRHVTPCVDAWCGSKSSSDEWCFLLSGSDKCDEEYSLGTFEHSRQHQCLRATGCRRGSPFKGDQCVGGDVCSCVASTPAAAHVTGLETAEHRCGWSIHRFRLGSACARQELAGMYGSQGVAYSYHAWLKSTSSATHFRAFSYILAPQNLFHLITRTSDHPAQGSFTGRLLLPKRSDRPLSLLSTEDRIPILDPTPPSRLWTQTARI